MSGRRHQSEALRRLRVSERSFDGRLMEVPTLETDEMSDWLDAAARRARAHTHAGLSDSPGHRRGFRLRYRQTALAMIKAGSEN